MDRIIAYPATRAAEGGRLQSERAAHLRAARERCVRSRLLKLCVPAPTTHRR
jgi:hypothetical protein